MKSKTKRQAFFPAALLLFALAAGSVPETVPAEEFFYAPETAVFLDLNEDYSGSYGYFRVENVTPTAYVDSADIQSSNPGVASVERVETCFKKRTENSYSDVCLRINGPGETDVTYTVGVRTCTTHVKVSEYENPLRTITLTGVNAGESFASLTQESADPDYGEAPGLELTGDRKGMELFLTTTEDWSIRSVKLNACSINNYALLDSYDRSDPAMVESSGIFRFSGLNKSKETNGMSGSLCIDLYNPTGRQAVSLYYAIY